MPLVRLTRAIPGPSGEDRFISINPANIAAVMDSTEENQVVLRLADGRGLLVRGTYDSVMAQLGRPIDEADEGFDEESGEE